MFSKVIVSNTLSNLRDINSEYYVDENSFQYAKKLTAEDTAGIILTNNGTNNNSQSRHFIKRINNNFFIKVLGSAFCQRRQQLQPELFKDENDKFIHNVYKQLGYLDKYNGKTLLADDTSIITLSNHTITKEQYGIRSKIDAKNIIPRARISCISDTFTNMILSADINIEASSEPKMAINQINKLENIIDLPNTIIIGD